MDEQNQILESFLSNVRVKQKQTAVLLTAVSLVLVIVGVSLLVYFSKQVKIKIDQVNHLEGQIAERQGRNDELRRESENAQAQLEATKNEISNEIEKLKKIDSSSWPKEARTALEDAISRIREAEFSVEKVETRLNATNQTTPPGSESSRSQAISDLFNNQPAIRLRAYKVLMDNYSTDPALIPELLSYARANIRNENGIYNALVVLSHLDKARLKPHVAEIQAFARDVKPTGTRIKERVDKLLSRLPA